MTSTPRMTRSRTGGIPRRPVTTTSRRRRLASWLAVATVLAGALVAASPTSSSAAVSSTSFRSRDLGGVPVGCNPVTYIQSLNADDDNANGIPDLRERIPLQAAGGGAVAEDNLRTFTFNQPGATRVYIAEPAQIPSNDIVLGTKVRAYQADGSSTFTFGEHPVPVTLNLEGIQESPGPNDVGFEYQYFRGDGTTVCGGFVQGTVVRAQAVLRVDSGAGASFSDHNKMLITGQADASGEVAPAGQVTPLWSYDAPGAVFSEPTALVTAFTAPPDITPAPRLNLDELRLTLTATATNPPNQQIEAHLPVNATSPQSVEFLSRDRRVAATTGWLNANRGTMDLFNSLFRYRLLDQFGIAITASAYAGKMPQIRENIGMVLTSPIREVREWIDRALRHSPDWKDQPDGAFADRIAIHGVNKDPIVVNEKGMRSFHPSLTTVGGIVMHIPAGAVHVWELSVSGQGIVQATRNLFVSRVSDTRNQARQIKIRSVYEVVLP